MILQQQRLTKAVKVVPHFHGAPGKHTSTIELARGGFNSLSVDFAWLPGPDVEPPFPPGVLPTLLDGVVPTDTLPDGLD